MMLAPPLIRISLTPGGVFGTARDSGRGNSYATAVSGAARAAARLPVVAALHGIRALELELENEDRLVGQHEPPLLGVRRTGAREGGDTFHGHANAVGRGTVNHVVRGVVPRDRAPDPD